MLFLWTSVTIDRQKRFHPSVGKALFIPQLIDSVNLELLKGQILQFSSQRNVIVLNRRFGPNNL